MKLRNLFVLYAELDKLRIVRILNLDRFLAFTAQSAYTDQMKIYCLSNVQLQKLHDRTLTSGELLNDHKKWRALADIEREYSEKHLDDLINQAAERSFSIKSVCRNIEDIMLNYDQLGDVLIVRILKLNTYFAVMTAGQENEDFFDSFKINRILYKDMLNRLNNKTLTELELKGDIYDWFPVEALSKSYKPKDLADLIDHAEESGLSLKEFLEKKTFPMRSESVIKLTVKEPETELNHENIKSTKNNTATSSVYPTDIITVCLLLGMILLFLWMTKINIEDLEHYRRVYDKPIAVTAVVSDHDFYTVSRKGSDKTYYRSYITYSVNGILYSEIDYEKKKSEENLTPIGTKVNTLVSPEDPSKLMSDLESDCEGIIYAIPLILISFLFFKYYITGNGLSVQSENMLKSETIQADIIASVKHRCLRPCLFFCSLAYIVLYIRYPMIIEPWTLGISAVSAFGWLICLINDLKDIGYAKKCNYSLRRDVLVNKGGYGAKKTHKLYYRSSDRTWNMEVTEKNTLKP